jgi:hypothetical protein
VGIQPSLEISSTNASTAILATLDGPIGWWQIRSLVVRFAICQCYCMSNQSFSLDALSSRLVFALGFVQPTSARSCAVQVGVCKSCHSSTMACRRVKNQRVVKVKWREALGRAKGSPRQRLAEKVRSKVRRTVLAQPVSSRVSFATRNRARTRLTSTALEMIHTQCSTCW